MISDSPVAQMWLSLSITMLDRSWRCGSIPPTIIPYFSTSLKPGVVFLVPAMTPFHSASLAASLNLRELPSALPRGTQRSTHTEAIPEHLDNRFKPTRSASNNCLAFPRTIATFVFVFGGTIAPSSINHSTLDISVTTRPGDNGSPASSIFEHLIEEWYAGENTLTFSTCHRTPCPLTPLLPSNHASCSSSPTTNPAQSKLGVSSWNHRGISCVQEGGSKWPRFCPG